MGDSYFCFMRSIVLILLLCAACVPADRPSENAEAKAVALEYAEGFSIHRHQDYTRVSVHHPYPSSTESFDYYLVDRDRPIPDFLTDKVVIRTPITSIACTSTTHIPLLEYLEELNSLKGFPNTDYISSEAARAYIETGDLVDLGLEQGLNLERLLELNPDMVMGYMYSGDKGQLGEVERLGIPVVMNGEYLEEHPLGRAEWIKFAGAFYGKLDVADSVFRVIADRYHAIANEYAGNSSAPTVMSGVVYGDTWYMPGGRNYAARMIADAGGQYLYRSDTSRSSIELSFEEVYETAHDADVWIGVASFSSLDALKASEERYSLFKPFRNGQVYSYNKRIGAKGGSEYLELGYLRPDLILNDLALIFHTDPVLGEELFFFTPLE